MKELLLTTFGIFLFLLLVFLIILIIIMISTTIKTMIDLKRGEK
jgi:hypothetical protein